jgi:hypothetical protein
LTPSFFHIASIATAIRLRFSDVPYSSFTSSGFFGP